MLIKSAKILLFAASLFLCSTTQAQRMKNFSNDAQVYINELRGFYKEDKNLEKDQQKAYEALITEYEGFWLQFRKPEQTRIMNISNAMLKLRLRPYPDFYKFLQTQVAFKKSQQTAESFNQWLLGLEAVLETKKVRDFTDLVEVTSQLINNNCLYESRTTRWSSSSNNFSFRFDNTLMVLFNEPMDLTCSSRVDSNVIVNTKGIYYPVQEKWQGQGGKVFWTRNELPENKCWAELKKYEANIKFSKFSADSILFTNMDYFKSPLLGRLDEDLGMPLAADKYTYPRFKSYQKDFTIKNVFPDIDYSGGFTMTGAKLLAAGVDNENARITIFKKGKPFILVESKSFYINKEQIASESATATVYMGADSIFNAGLQFRYINSNKEVRLLNDKDRNYCSPFEDTYHKLDLYCDGIYWIMDNEDIDFSTTRAKGASSFAQFESQNYFSTERYNTIKGIDNISPLERVRNYCLKNKTRNFYIDEFTAYIKMDPIQAKTMLHTLARYGFLNVNNKDEYVYVKQKLLDFSKSNMKSVDYDAIILSSALNSGEANATLDLKTNDLKLRGVEKFMLSDTQNVVITPVNQEVIVKKNRDLAFDGRITAGRFIMTVKNSYFTYDEFKIDLKQIDSLRFYVTSFTDDKKLALIKTPLQNLKAELLIDRKDNKASLKQLEDYPILNSLDYSYAYYEEPYIKEGVYKRNKFYYKLNPFTIKKLFKFETDSLIFVGVLKSANIFPDINEPLKVQPDYSLGFVMKTPQGGLPLYGGKGQYHETIDLSYKGFLGRGKIEYLSSETRSKDIVFMPDSMHAVTDTFFVKEQLAAGGKYDFPDVQVARSIERWYPYENKMYVYQDKDPFQMYKKEVLMHGHLLLTPVGMSGSGVSKIDEADLVAERFDFKQTNLNSPQSEFILHGENSNEWAFYSKNVKSKVDFKTRKGEFVSNDSLARVTLPILQYAAYIDKFTWEMDKAELALANSKSESSIAIEKMDKRNLISAKMPGALYVSTNPQQDSLHFWATKANFKYKQNLLNSDQVFMVKVADAAIFPANRKLAIKTGAKMDAFEKASLIFNIEQKYHQLYDANVKINGSKSYLASGYIDYVDETKAKQKIYLSSIEPNASQVSTGIGTITDSNRFTLSPAFAFKGDVIVNAKEQFFTFDGGVQLKHKCTQEGEELAWVRFKSPIVPDSIYIPVKDVLSEFSGARTTASILYGRQSLQPVSAFLTRDTAKDNQIISASGFLTFNKKKSEYQIGSMEKLSNPEEGKGNFLTFNQTTCTAKGDGLLNFGLNQGPIKSLLFGSIKVNNQKNESETDLTLGLEFPFSKKAMDFMSQSINEDLGVEMLDFSTNTKVFKLLRQFVSNESKVEKLEEELKTMGNLKNFPQELNYSLLLSDIKLKYAAGDPRTGYIYSGFASVLKAGEKQQYKLVKTSVQLCRYKATTTLNIYIELSLDHWYFFSLEETGRNIKMRALSSLGEFNDMISAMKPEERKVEGKKEEPNYEYFLAIPQLKSNFIKRVQGLNKDEEEVEKEDMPDDDSETE